MSFESHRRRVFSCPVSVSLPGTAPEQFTAQFLELSEREWALMVSRRMSEDALADAVLVGWEDITERNGEAMPFSERNKARLLSVPSVRRALLLSYLTAVGVASSLRH